MALGGRNILVAGASRIAAQTGITLNAQESINFNGLKTLSSEGYINLFANGSVDVSGVQITTTQDGGVSLIANQNIFLTGTKISGGGTTIVANGDITGKGASIDTSTPSGIPGRIFLASISGAIDLGTDSTITTGATAPGTIPIGPGALFAISAASYNGLTLGTITAPGGEIVLGSGIEIVGDRFNGWLAKVFSGETHLGSGGITVGDVSIRTDGSLQDARLIVHATNGNLIANSLSGNGGLISVLTPFDASVNNGINNVSTGLTGGQILFAFGEHVNIPTGINNDSVNGSGGTITISADSKNGFILGADLRISNNAGTDGGLIVAENILGSIGIDPTGVQASTNGDGTSLELHTFGIEAPGTITVSSDLTLGDAKNNGNGGRLLFSTYGLGDAIVISDAKISSNGAGTGRGGIIGINSAGNAKLSSSILTANGGSSGDGGTISVSGRQLESKNVTMDANGLGTGSGGIITFSLTESAELTGSSIKASARGANGGWLSIYSDGNITADTAFFNISPTGGVPGAGNGGIITLSSWSGSVTTTGNLNVDGVNAGNGGEIHLRSEGMASSLTIGGKGSTRFFARGGSEGGSGGRIDIRTGGDMMVLDTATLSAQVRGAQGNGGTIVLIAGRASAGGSLYLNRSLNVSGMGDGNGGTIYLAARTTGDGGEGPVGTFAAVGPSAGRGLFINAALTANSGTGIGNGGIVQAGLDGDDGKLQITANINANAGQQGRGGFIEINSYGTLSTGTAESANTIYARGGTSSGDGGLIKLDGYSDMDLGNVSLISDARSTGNGGVIVITQHKSAGGPVGTFAFGINALDDNESAPIFIASKLADASGFGAEKKGGAIIVNIPGDLHFSRQGNVMTANGQAFAVGGTLSYTASGNIVVDNGVVLTSLASQGDAKGGEIQLNAGKSVTINGTLNVSGHGSGSGGKILIGNQSSVSNITVSRDLLADGGATGDGGEISLTAKGADSKITVGASDQARNLVARGGTSGGSGGKISLASGGDIILNGAFISTSTRAGSAKAGDISIKAGTSGAEGTIQFTGDITASAEGAGNGGKILLEQSSSQSLALAGHVYARANGTGNGGEISFFNPNGINLTLNNTVSADSKSGEPGVILFNVRSADESSNPPVDVNVNGSGALEGKVEFRTVNNVDLNLSGANNNLNLSKVESSGSHVRISTPTSGSRITIESAASIANSHGSIELKAPEITNDATIKASNLIELSSDIGLKVKGNGTLQITGSAGDVKLTAASGETLSLEGIQSFDAANGTVTWSAIGDGGFINVLENNNQKIAGGSSLQILTPHLALRESVELKTSAGGSIVIDSGNSTAVARITAVNPGKTTTISTSGGSSGKISVKGAGVTFAGSDTTLVLDTSSTESNGGAIEILATTGSIQNGSKHLTLRSSGLVGGDISISSLEGAVNLNRTNMTAETIEGSLPSDSSRIQITALKGVTLSGPIQAISNQKGGAIEIKGSSIVAADDVPNSPPLTLQAYGKVSGGAVKLTATTGGIDLTKFSLDVGLTGENGDGGNLDVAATNGSIKFSGDISVNGKGTGSGGTISLMAKSFNFSVNEHVILTADAGSVGSGGKVSIVSSNQSITLGSGANRFALSALGSNATNGGEISISSGLNLSYFGGIATKSDHSAAKIELAAAGRLLLDSSINVSDNSKSGQISLSANVVEISRDVSLSATGSSTHRSIIIQAKSGVDFPQINIAEGVSISTSDTNSGGVIKVSSAGDIRTKMVRFDSSGTSAISSRGSIELFSAETLEAVGNLTLTNTGSGDLDSRIYIKAGHLDVTNANLVVSADTNAFGGVAGTIEIETTVGDLDLSNLASPITADATFNSAGRVALRSVGNITIGGAGLSAGARSDLFATAGSIDISTSSSSGTITLNGPIKAVGFPSIGVPNLIAFRNSNGGHLKVIVDAGVHSSGAIAFSSAGDLVVQRGTSAAGNLVADAGVFIGQLTATGQFSGNGPNLAGSANSIDVNMTSNIAPSNGAISIALASASNLVQIQGNTTSIKSKVTSTNGDVFIFGATQIHSAGEIRADNGLISMQTRTLDHGSGAKYFASGSIDLIGRDSFVSTTTDSNTDLQIAGQSWIFDSKASLRVFGRNISIASMGRSTNSNVEIRTAVGQVDAVIHLGNAAGFVTSNGTLQVVFGDLGNNQLRGNSPLGRGILGGTRVDLIAAKSNLIINGVDVHGFESSTVRGQLGLSLTNTKVTGTNFVDLLVGNDRPHGTTSGTSTSPPSDLQITGSGTIQCFGTINVFGSGNTASVPSGKSITIDAEQGQIDLNGSVDIRAEFNPIAFTEINVAERGTGILRKDWQSEDCRCSSFGTIELGKSTNVVTVNGAGELLLRANRDMVLRILDSRIVIARNSVVHIELSNEFAKVRNLHDEKFNALMVAVGKSHFSIASGEELIFGKLKFGGMNPDSLGRRKILSRNENGCLTQWAEYSLPSLMLSSRLQLLLANDCQLAGKILKTAAAMQVLNMGREPYKVN